MLARDLKNFGGFFVGVRFGAPIGIISTPLTFCGSLIGEVELALVVHLSGEEFEVNFKFPFCVLVWNIFMTPAFTAAVLELDFFGDCNCCSNLLLLLVWWPFA